MCTIIPTLDEALQCSGKGVTHDTVMQLTENYQGKFHLLFMDNFYTSPTLFTLLWNARIRACGTLHCNRTRTPDLIRNPPLRKVKSSLSKMGDCSFSNGKTNRKSSFSASYDTMVTKCRCTLSVPGGFEEIFKPACMQLQQVYGWG